MRHHPILRPSLAAILALALTAEIGVAQPMGGSQVDPPSRVGRVARLLGTVSFRGAEQAEWQAAVTNYPVTSGNVFWTEPSSAAEIGVGATLIALDQSTELDIDILDDRTLQATQPQGAVFLRVGQMPDGDLYRITTPRGAVVLTKAGAYEIVAGDADHPTLVAVIEGGARIDSTNASLTLGAGQTGRIDGVSNFAASVGPAVMDRFLTARIEQERDATRNRAAIRVAPPRAVAQMSGGEALASSGIWANSASYGEIWYPPVQASWVPYRDGHWGYVAPWGWTWIDDAPWGFAPFHYGRWVQDGPRWGWIPAERGVTVAVRQAPVYAPALVSFISVGVAVGVALSQGERRDPRGSVGWVPLGPRETYVPPYKTSDRYVKAVNVTNVTNVTNINTVTNISNVNNLVNRRGATVVPVTAMTASQPVAARREAITTQALANAQPQRVAPVQPTTATIGVTPVVARDLKLAPPASPLQKIVAAPGPVVPPPAAVPVIVQSQPAVPVVMPLAGRPNNSRTQAKPGTAPVAAAPVAVTLPVLRAPTPEAPAHPQVGRAPVATAPGAVVPPVPIATPDVKPMVNTPPVSAPLLPAPVPQPLRPPVPDIAKPMVPAPAVLPLPNAVKPMPPGVTAPVAPIAPALQPARPLVPDIAKPVVPAPAVPPVPNAVKPVTPPVVTAPVAPISPAPQPARPPAPDIAKPVVPAPEVLPVPNAVKPVTPPVVTAPVVPIAPVPQQVRPLSPAIQGDRPPTPDAGKGGNRPVEPQGQRGKSDIVPAPTAQAPVPPAIAKPDTPARGSQGQGKSDAGPAPQAATPQNHIAVPVPSTPISRVPATPEAGKGADTKPKP